MAIEIERKFLVTDDAWQKTAEPGIAYRQGYVSTKPVAVRVRIAGDRGYITMKGAPLQSDGLSRLEFEYPIPLSDAEAMLTSFCQDVHLSKTRYRVPFEGYVWEVDVFHGRHEGLVMAEVEMESADANPPLPSWVGGDVSDDPRYTNAALAGSDGIPPFKK